MYASSHRKITHFRQLMVLWIILLLFGPSYAMSPTKVPPIANDDPVSEKSEYRIENGHISLNDSEIIILINSTFEVIEDFERTNFTDIDEMSNETEIDTTRRPPTRFHKFRPATCRSYSTKEKYMKLEDVGGRNQMYMADSPEEASMGFASVYPEEDNIERTFADHVQEDIDPHFCDSNCERIRNALTTALKERARESEERRVQTARADDIMLSDAGPTEVDEGLGAGGGACYLESFIPIGNCTEPGEEGTWTHENLCSECRGIYMLNRNCFPTFFNTVKCNRKEMGCIFDTFSHKAHGECSSQSMSFKVLRNRGDNSCEDWVIEQIQLPVACQCMLSKTSWLRSRPPKEL